MKFKIGDKVRILPSANFIGVLKSEIGKIVKITGISTFNTNDIMISDSRGDTHGCWCVNEYDIAPVIKVGQQLLLWEDMYE